MEINHEIISTVILLSPLNHLRRVVVSYKRKYVHELLVNRLFKPAQKNVWLGADRPALTIAVDLGRKATKQTEQTEPSLVAHAISDKILCVGSLMSSNIFFL